MIGLCASVVCRRTASSVGAVVLVVAALAYTSVELGLLSSTWMPFVYPWPFLLLLVAATSVVSGAPRDVWMVALAGGLLVHGHVSFVMFVGVIGGVVALSMVVRRLRQGAWGLDRRSVIATAGLWASSPCPSWSTSSCTGRVSWAATGGTAPRVWARSSPTRSTSSVCTGGTPVGPPSSPPSSSGSSSWARGGRPTGSCGLSSSPGRASSSLATVLLVVYAVRGVDDLAFRYVGVFYYAVPILLAVLVGVTVADRLRALPLPTWARHPAPAWLGIAVVGALVLVVREPLLTNPYPGAGWVPAAFRAIEAQAPGRGDRAALRDAGLAGRGRPRGAGPP